MRDIETIGREIALAPSPQPLSRDIIKEIAMDIGKELVAYVEVQYPDAIKATSSTFRLSLRNSVYNKIMAALETTDEAEIKDRLERNRRFRRELTAAWKRIRQDIAARDEPSSAFYIVQRSVVELAGATDPERIARHIMRELHRAGFVVVKEPRDA